jgi:exodeoxyribonuclease V alpha subunit
MSDVAAGPIPGAAVVIPFVEAGVLGTFDVQLIAAFGRLVPDVGGLDLLALGLVSRATRSGHVCVEVDRLSDMVADEGSDTGDHSALDWPSSEAWVAALSASPLVATAETATTGPTRPLVLDHGRLYLQRYWAYEVLVTGGLAERSDRVAPPLGGAGQDDAAVDYVLAALFGADGADRQRLAASRALRNIVTVIAGGPGTGKTHTVARVLAAAFLLAERGTTEVRVALAAPTGKAAMRMRTAVRDQVAAMAGSGLVTPALAERLAAVEPSTIHRLLIGAGRASTDADVPVTLPLDLVIVDETSMVSLPLMARLITALGPDARLVLVGDPFQLASIEAGTVMDDIVGPGDLAPAGESCPLSGKVTVLTRRHRFEEESGIALLADAVRTGDTARALEILTEGRDDATWVRDDDGARLAVLRSEVAASSIRVAEAALDGRAGEALEEAERVKVLAAIRFGPLGRFDWSDRIERAVARALPEVPRLGQVRVGTPIMVTGNDRSNGLFNGDVGVLVRTDDGPRVAVDSMDEVRRLPLSRIGQWETWWAMTIHKSQGSEFVHAIVSLPTMGSRILTRELLYTAVTRARDKVTVVGGEDAIRSAIDRPVARASGLRDRLWSGA